MRTAAAVVVLGTAAAVALVTFGGCERRAEAEPAPRTIPAPSIASSPIVPAAPTAERRRPAATGGVALIASAAEAEAVVTGTVADVQSLDLHGWRATVRVDRALLGDVRLGDTLTVAWEELSSARRVRLVDGERVLLALDPLPSQSLWRKRFPARARAGRVLVIAANGEAFLPSPDGVTVDALGHYLAMTRDARAGGPGARRLADLVRGAHPSVAREAMAMLAATATGDHLGADGGAALLAAAGSSERDPALRAAALRLAARHRLPGAREAALALASADSPIRVDAYRALAAFPGAVAAADVERLLGGSDAELRAVGVELAPAAIGRERLVTVLRTDAAPGVRLAAGRALLKRYEEAAIPDVVGALDDADGGVRSGIAEAIGALGTPAVAPLRTVVDGGSERAALAAVLGLSRTGSQGAVVIAAIAESHRNEAVRAFAGLALGEAPGHEH